MNHPDRLAALRARIEAPTLVSSLPNLRYLTGFTGSSAHLLVSPDGPATFVTDGRYGEAAESLVSPLHDTDLVVYTGGMWDTFRDLMAAIDAVTLEADAVTWKFADEFARETGVKTVSGGGAVERLRRVKDPDETAALEAAAAAGDAAFSALRGLADLGPTERELGRGLVEVMRSNGGDTADWAPIVAAGAGASVPHHESGEKKVGDGLLLLDYGCVVDGYHSDMTRTVWLGDALDDEMEKVHGAVLESQEAGIAAIGPGVPCGDVDEAVREVLRSHGYEEQFLHSTGHGVGLEIHEAPWLRRGNDDPLEVGNVVTVEPGVYLPGRGGVRIEDMVLVAEGGPRILTKSRRQLRAP